MAKWADYVITKVRYNKDRTHIEQVRVSDDDGDGLSGARDESRQTVVNNLKARKTYVTGPPSTTEPSKITKGAPVGIVKIDGKEYLRTDANNTKRDNLGNLPEY